MYFHICNQYFGGEWRPGLNVAFKGYIQGAIQKTFIERGNQAIAVLNMK